MAKRPTNYNNLLIVLVAGVGILLLSLSRLVDSQDNSVTLLPAEANLAALVFSGVVLHQQQGEWQATPSQPHSELQRLVMAWQQARLVPVVTPLERLEVPIQVDLYLTASGEPQTVLLYPEGQMIKLLAQPQWWRLVNLDMNTLLPTASPARNESDGV
ncbi:hypothetical protein [Ferrimonas pelagia]|uniref:Uncharacterized protein n=1 Tax=Ferrimonas pelagia TaxID=1177826 RepID=A0ABP9F695_9GAMM